MAPYNKTLGKFQLMGIPPAPRGVPQIEVTFDIDANGILHGVGQGPAAPATSSRSAIKGGSGLSEDEIQRMVRDAESHADEDRAAQGAGRRHATRPRAPSTRHEKSLAEHGDKVDDESPARASSPRSPTSARSLEGGDAASHPARRPRRSARPRSSSPRRSTPQAAAGPATGRRRGGADEPDEEIVEDAEVVDDPTRRGRNDRRARTTSSGARCTERGAVRARSDGTSRRSPSPRPSRRSGDEYLEPLPPRGGGVRQLQKRIAREQQATTQRATERIVAGLLPVLDDLERAVDAFAEHDKEHVQEGVGARAPRADRRCSRRRASRRSIRWASRSIRTTTRRCSSSRPMLPRDPSSRSCRGVHARRARHPSGPRHRRGASGVRGPSSPPPPIPQPASTAWPAPPRPSCGSPRPCCGSSPAAP